MVSENSAKLWSSIFRFMTECTTSFTRDVTAMAWKDKSSASYTGGSGQMAVIAELLHRKCNAAIPHIDVGTDVFAFRDDNDEVARIQVKTASGKRYQNDGGYSAKFGIPIVQLESSDEPPLYYALAVRLNRGWGEFVVISRAKLQEFWKQGCGSKNDKSGNLELHLQFRPVSDKSQSVNSDFLQVFCGIFDLSEQLNAWESLPPLKSP
jgi:hypothetical protein